MIDPRRVCAVLDAISGEKTLDYFERKCPEEFKDHPELAEYYNKLLIDYKAFQIFVYETAHIGIFECEHSQWAESFLKIEEGLIEAKMIPRQWNWRAKLDAGSIRLL